MLSTCSIVREDIGKCAGHVDVLFLLIQVKGPIKEKLVEFGTFGRRGSTAIPTPFPLPCVCQIRDRTQESRYLSSAQAQIIFIDSFLRNLRDASWETCPKEALARFARVLSATKRSACYLPFI